ncbi:MAG TPA: GNAT family N-acetyltransferase [Acidimicrobiales bacterium]|nr:GNAT family N-acetyltransferase [Acidimicrobiales bacterium]
MEPAEHRRAPVVEHDREGERLVVREGGQVAELEYHRRGDRLSILHTGVPAPLGGKGLGSALVRAAVELAAAEGLTVVPYCPFAQRWLEDHPDVAASVSVEQP